MRGDGWFRLKRKSPKQKKKTYEPSADPNYPSFSDKLKDNEKAIRKLLGDSTDFITRELMISWGEERNHPILLLYLDGMADSRAIQNDILPSLMDRQPSSDWPRGDVLGAIQSILTVSDMCRVELSKEAVSAVLQGGLLILTEASTDALSIALPGWQDRGVSETQTQTVVRGPQEAFNENLRTNTTLIRRKIHDPRLWMVTRTVGNVTKTNVAIMYMNGIATDEDVNQVLQRIDQIDIDSVFDGEYIEEFLQTKQKTLFPTVYNTERPDTVASGLVEGRIAILVEGTPFVLLVPALFIDFIQSAEDYYQSYIFGTLIRSVRLLALVIALLAPSIYVALTTFHQEMIPTQLLFSLAAQREGIPFPAFIEALLMEVTFEILREAGIRMPRSIGQAVSIVGTIVIGQAAVEAGIVSAGMVIIVAITAISSFVIPSYNMAIAIRIIRFVLMILAATFGLYGIMTGCLVLVIHLSGLRSLGIPYMSPLGPYQANKLSDSVFRLPERLMNKGDRVGSRRGLR
ncbi:spore germination protein [Paenibacillus sp. GCM10023252]|uniref:spore germination protein n=1 Tax=Paenibacillus sp. GCM10023252 TaxID=3252649 RepID=UPI003621263B